MKQYIEPDFDVVECGDDLVRTSDGTGTGTDTDIPTSTTATRASL